MSKSNMSAKEPRGRITILLLFAGFLAIALFGWWSLLKQEKQMRSMLLSEARMAAKGINWRHVRMLTASEADLASPYYQRLKEQLTMVRAANPQQRFIYLIGQRPDKSLFIFVDSESPDSKDYSPPGQDYTEAPDAFKQIFVTGHESVTEPVEDRWGEWITALVPVIDPETGKHLAIFGVDRDAGNWNRDLAIHVAEQLALYLMFVAPLIVFLLQRQRNDRFLRASRQYHLDIIQFYPDATLVIDSQGKVTAWNRAMEEFSGIKAEEILGKGDYEYALPFYGERRPILIDLVALPQKELEEKYSQIERRGNTLFAEAYINNARGEKYYFNGTASALRNSSGEVIGAIESIRDITERKRTEEEVCFKNLILATVQECSIDGILVVNDNTAIISYNQRFVEMWGIAPELVEAGEDEPVLRFVANQPVEQEGFLARVRYLYAHREEKSREEIVLKDGRVFDRYSAPMTGSDGRYYGRVWYFSDITARKQMEVEVNRTSNLASIGLLAGGLAHDFNNVLNIIYGNISFAKMLAGGESAVVEPLTDAEEACEHAKELGLRLQALAQGNSPLKEPISLPAIIESAADSQIKDSGMSYTISVADDLMPVEGDPRQIKQVFENLLTNAMEADSAGGTVRIDIVNCTVNRDMGLPIKAGNYVRITLQDDGRGIPEENLPKIFDPYFSTKDTYSQKGLGLGLSICHAILKRHSGHISVESIGGIGTIVTVYLPASRGASKSAAEGGA